MDTNKPDSQQWEKDFDSEIEDQAKEANCIDCGDRRLTMKPCNFCGQFVCRECEHRGLCIDCVENA